MRRLLTVSALFALAVCVTGASGQPPAKLDPPPKALGERLDKKPDPTDAAIAAALAKALGERLDKKPDPTDAAIAAALANDPDVKMARAKIQLAEAELAKARLAVTLKVVTLKTTIELHKTAVEVATQQYKLAATRVTAGGGTQTELLDARVMLLRAQAPLATAEAELRLLTGGAAVAAADAAVKVGLDRLAEQSVLERKILLEHVVLELVLNVAKGPIPDRIRAALDKPVKLGAKGEKVTFAQALEIFKKDAGLDVPVRPLPSPLPVIVSEGEELPVGAWFQLYQDTAGQQNPGFAFYVREYGLLVANKQSAPPDAPTLTEFWKLKPPTKEPKVESVPKK